MVDDDIAADAAAAPTSTLPEKQQQVEVESAILAQDQYGFEIDPSRAINKQQQQTIKHTQPFCEDPWEFLSRITKDKLLDASDVTDVNSAKNEIKLIRQYAKQLLTHLQDANLLDSDAVLGTSSHVMRMDQHDVGLHSPILEEDIIVEQDEQHVNDGEATKGEQDDDRGALYDKQDFSSFKSEKSWKSDEIRSLIHSAIRKKELFENDSEEEMLELVDVFKQFDFKAGECVIRQGEFDDRFFVVVSGRLNVHVNVGEKGIESQVNVGTYGQGDAFGDSALIIGSPRTATVTAITDCELWSLDRQTYRCVISQLRYNQHEEKMSFFRTCEINGRVFTEIFDGDQIDDLALAAKADSYDEGSVIIREGEASDVFFFVRSGSVNTYKKGAHDTTETKAASTLDSLQYSMDSSFNDASLAFTIPEKRAFGTTSLLKGTVSPYSYVAKTPVSVYYITKDDFELMLGTLQNALDGNTVSRSVAREKSKRSFKDRDRDALTMIADRIHDHLELDDLIFYNMLGKGAFGRVTLVQSKQDKALFALKSQMKHFIVKRNQQQHVLDEYRIMKSIGHDPFILGMHNCMQDERYLYFLIDLLPGGELMNYHRKYRKFTEAMSKFYTASVILAFERLHSELIAYRDLKPENMVLDKDGYSVLVDFGLAKQIEEGQTYTFCGTPDYLAPEIIRGTGHDWGVDYWELGIFLFETVHGRAPFYSSTPNRRTRKILKGYSYVAVPSQFSEALSDLISHLLVADQSKRLGRTQHGIQGIKNHRFFAGFDWDGLQERRIEPPIKPKIPQDMKTLGKNIPFDDSMVPKSEWNPDLKTLEGWL